MRDDGGADDDAPPLRREDSGYSAPPVDSGYRYTSVGSGYSYAPVAPKRTSPESRRLEVARAMKVDLEVDLTANRSGPMPPFLREFVETLKRVDEEVHGIAAEDIETVELAFGYSNLMDEFWAGGFIVRLRDGRRAFLGSSYGPGGWKSSDKPTVEMVAADLPRSEFKPEWLPDKRGDAWEENPDGINEFLKSLPRPQTDNSKTIH